MKSQVLLNILVIPVTFLALCCSVSVKKKPYNIGLKDLDN